MKVLVFGGNGFLGKAFAVLLKAKQIDCFVVSRSENSDYAIDISQYEDFKILPDNFFDVVVNCATILPGGNYLDNNYLDGIYKTNILGTQHICKWIDGQTSVKRIVNCSTLAVIKKPWRVGLTENEFTYPIGNHVLYSSSKLMQELLFSTFAVSKSIILSHIRFSALYGPEMKWGGLICNLIDQAKKYKKINLTNASKVSADFLHVDDAAKIILATIDSDYEGIVNGASGKETTVLELAAIIADHFGSVIISNTESESFNDDRAVINIERLKEITDTNGFIDIKTGIKQIIVK
ncbi:MAG: NAD(P)-dependent oxidoreductase [Flavobacterium sp.]|nr:NAD(P)-dependent oxidoreductase [Flavobacterium sp.]